MKRKILALLMTLLMLLTVAGCSTEGLNLYEEMKKTSAWEAVETKGSMLIAAEVQGEKFELGADISGYSHTKEMQAYIEMNINTIKLGNTNQTIKMSPVKIYLDQQALYISKTYFTELMSLSGAELPETLKSIEAEYIGIDLNAAGTEALILKPEKAIELTETLFKGSDIKLPITKNGRAYTIELNADQMVDLSIEFIKEIMGNLDLINEISDTGLTQAELDESAAEISQALEEGKALAKPALKGSKATVKYTFGDTTYEENMDVNFKVAFGGEELTFDIHVDSEAKKIAKKEFELPTSKVLYTMEDLVGLMLPAPTFDGTGTPEDTAIVQVASDDILIKGEETYIPLRSTVEPLGFKVQYDPATKEIKVSADYSEFTVKTIQAQGISYVSLKELAKIGELHIIEQEEGLLILK